MFDLFVSYASEDAESVAELEALLIELGVTVWLDTHELAKPIAQLDDTIYSAICLCSHAALFLTPTYLEKDYTSRKELPCLLERERIGRIGVFAVLHGVDNCIDRVRIRIGDKPGLDTSRGMRSVAESIAEKIGRNQQRVAQRYYYNFNFDHALIDNAMAACNELVSGSREADLKLQYDLSADDSWIGNTSDQFISVVYRLYSPLAVFCSVRYGHIRSIHGLSRLDRIRVELLEAAVQVLLNEQSLAHSGKRIKYSPRIPDWRKKRHLNPSQFWWQGISDRRLEAALQFLILPDSDSEFVAKLKSEEAFREQFRAAKKLGGKAAQALGILANPLFGFTPTSRPVYFRVLWVWIACYKMYQDLSESEDADSDMPLSERYVKSLFPDTSATDNSDELIESLDSYWSDYVKPRLTRVIDG